ncbi:hypothetical protein GJ496_004677 [Pomphorhynchus laevis]|nr:hypothetical protein GJ496_004677 [Pomphorhynchus laevis]
MICPFFLIFIAEVTQSTSFISLPGHFVIDNHIDIGALSNVVYALIGIPAISDDVPKSPLLSSKPYENIRSLIIFSQNPEATAKSLNLPLISDYRKLLTFDLTNDKVDLDQISKQCQKSPSICIIKISENHSTVDNQKFLCSKLVDINNDACLTDEGWQPLKNGNVNQDDDMPPDFGNSDFSTFLIGSLLFMATSEFNKDRSGIIYTAASSIRPKQD